MTSNPAPHDNSIPWCKYSTSVKCVALRLVQRDITTTAARCMQIGQNRSQTSSTLYILHFTKSEALQIQIENLLELNISNDGLHHEHDQQNYQTHNPTILTY